MGFVQILQNWNILAHWFIVLKKSCLCKVLHVFFLFSSLFLLWFFLVFAGFCFSFLLILFVISFSFYVLMTYLESWLKSSFHCWESDEASRVSLWYSKTVSIHTNPLHLPLFMSWVVEFCASFVESPVS
jgi:hypothetical protein